jgi:integrase
LADLIELGMWTGARIEELCALPLARVNLEAGSLRIEDAKTMPDGGRFLFTSSSNRLWSDW